MATSTQLKVFAIYLTNFDLIGLFSTREKAQVILQGKDSLSDYYIQEIELDQLDGSQVIKPTWSVLMDAETGEIPYWANSFNKESYYRLFDKDKEYLVKIMSSPINKDGTPTDKHASINVISTISLEHAQQIAERERAIYLKLKGQLQ